MTPEMLVFLFFTTALVMSPESCLAQDGTQDPPTCFESGECTFSLLVEDWPASDAQQCLELCRDLTSCLYFTFKGDEGTCLGFANCQEFSPDTCQDCYSGRDTCDDLVCWETGGCNGVFLDEFPTSGASDCHQACLDSEACLWFTYNDADNACFLMADCQFFDQECKTCLTGQKQCGDRKEYTKFIMIGGKNEDGDTDSVDLVDLAISGDTTCNLPNYPLVTLQATASVVDGKIKSCRGDFDTVACYDYDPVTNVWSDAASMPQGGRHSRSSVIGGTWFITGGLTTDSVILDSTLIWSEESDGPKDGPFLPSPMWGHCQVTVNSSYVFVADTQFRADGATYLLEWETKEWTSLQNALQFRNVAVCGLVQSEDYGPEVVVAGDGTSDIFSLRTLTWREGPDLPDPWVERLHGPAQMLETFLVVGGYDQVDNAESNYSDPLNYPDAIYKFDPVNYKWITEGQHIPRHMAYGAVVPIPDGFLPCLDED